ncbi:MAG TPA: YciI family protein [Caulobacteraceae bacterium]|jgi:uncharacterized protein YciI|nr:YciI family protein [Caulobacteraceae bacterium]
MPLFVIHCNDKPDSLALRLATRPEHLAYLKTATALRLAGPYLNTAGEPDGSMLIVEAEDEAAAQAFAAADPYAKAGLFASTSIRRWNHTVGQLP